MKYFNLILIISISNLCFGQAIGDLDVSFGEDGIIITESPAGTFTCYTIELQQDGKIVAAGMAHSGPPRGFAIFRYNVNGTLDTTFSNDGILLISNDSIATNEARSIVFQTDGKIIIGGNDNHDPEGDFVLFRLHENGIIDSSFGNNGFVISPFNDTDDELRAVVLQPGDGKILVSGTMFDTLTEKYSLGVIRYNSNGIIDSSFSENGIQLNSFDSYYFYVRTMILQEDGKIVIGGFDYNSNFCIVRYHSNGTLDNGFGIDGKVTHFFSGQFQYGESLGIQNDGKIILAGWWHPGNQAYSHALLMRVNNDGSLDYSFGINGFVDTDFGYDEDRIWSIAIQDDGKIIGAGGSNSRFAAVRYKQNGIIDSSFGFNGFILTDITEEYDLAYDISIQPDGNFVLAGVADGHFGLARYINDANVVINNITANDNSILLFPNPVSSNVTLQYTLQQEETVSIYLYDLQGRKIVTVFENKILASGVYDQDIQIPKTLSGGNYILSVETLYSKASVEFTKL